MAATLADSEGPFVFIDEMENGLHHSTLEPVWQRFASLTRERNVQLFATTHSEECVLAAARAFNAANDDGLRVIRLDRREHTTEAQIYDRQLLSATEELGVEIRGCNRSSSGQQKTLDTGAHRI
jgi:AAA15 family ATPase/GTPase